jgi:hypothetical protein
MRLICLQRKIVYPYAKVNCWVGVGRLSMVVVQLVEPIALQGAKYWVDQPFAKRMHCHWLLDCLVGWLACTRIAFRL